MARIDSKMSYKLPPLVPAKMAGTSSPELTKYVAKVTGHTRKNVIKYATYALGPESANICHDQSKFREEKDKPTLAHGNWSEVKSVCVAGLPQTPENCKYVRKTIKLERNPKFLEVSVRDAYFLNMLQDVRLDGKPIVPQVYEFYMCGELHEFAIIMDRYDTDMLVYGYESFKNYNEPIKHIPILQFMYSSAITVPPRSHSLPSSVGGAVAGAAAAVVKESLPVIIRKSNLLFRFDYLVRMFQIAHTLTIFGVINFDLKIDQFLYSRSAGNVVITDFGFGADFTKNTIDPEQRYWKMIMGWPESSYGCHTIADITDAKVTTRHWMENYINMRKYINIWQLSSQLVNSYNTFAIFPDKSVKLFIGFKIPDEVFNAFKFFCNRYPPPQILVSSPSAAAAKPIDSFTLNFDSLGFTDPLMS